MCVRQFMNIPYNQLGKAGYNRGINRQHVNRIKKNFHEDMVQPAIVSYRDGKHWIVDHQHQTQAKYELNGCDPNILIYCDVRMGLTYEQEAELYYRLNTGSKPLGFPDLLKGLIESKDETALKFRDIVESCGYVVGGNTSTSLRALKSAWKIFNDDNGEQKLADILSLTKACWPDNINGVDTRMLDGIVLFIRYHADEYDRKRFIDVLSKYDPKDIIRKARTYFTQMDMRSYTQPYCTYSIITNCYNTGLRNKLTLMPAEA